MEFQKIKKIVAPPKITYGMLKYKKTLSPKKEHSNKIIEKVSYIYAYFGKEYSPPIECSNSIISKSRNPLPWGEWINGLYPFFITHKDKIYLRITPDLEKAVENKFYLNGFLIDKEYIINLLSSKDIRHVKPKETPAVMSVDIQNIYEISIIEKYDVI